MTDIEKATIQAREAFAVERAKFEPLIVSMDTSVDGLGKSAHFTAKAIDGSNIEVTYVGVSERMHDLTCVSVLTTEPLGRDSIGDGSLRFIAHGWKGKPDFTTTGIDPAADADPQVFEVGPSENNRIVAAIIDAASAYLRDHPGSMAAAGCLHSARKIYLAEIEVARHQSALTNSETALANCRFAYEMFLEKALELHPELQEENAPSSPAM
ncbi:hypothetical protein [Bosea sp. RAC05]|uniref:hypothetical protein n=1 Tax=Bosea sp. RAC05 TaxID=1842539 RepID=UPI00083DC47B|nr:hypothetical protein [Bosea sp. RAC05]AOG02972.1 hypothetical protein BSY19_4983 [Bosea sp. RAC05]